MLYIINTLSYPPDNGRFTLPSGQLGVLQITVPKGGSVNLTMAQLIVNQDNYPQDRSIRCWISQVQGGQSVDYLPGSTWHLSALVHTPITVYDTSLPGPAEDPLGISVAIPVMPGDYWLNALNLVNEPNSFNLMIA